MKFPTAQEVRAIVKTNRNVGRDRLPEEQNDEEWDLEFDTVLEDIRCGDADDAYDRAKDKKLEEKREKRQP
jgi:hypothetical protein